MAGDGEKKKKKAKKDKDGEKKPKKTKKPKGETDKSIILIFIITYSWMVEKIVVKME